MADDRKSQSLYCSTGRVCRAARREQDARGDPGKSISSADKDGRLDDEEPSAKGIASTLSLQLFSPVQKLLL